MKTSKLSCFLAITLASGIYSSSTANGQILLGSYYNSSSSQSVNTVADFTAAGVTGPGGAALQSTDIVDGFDFSPTAGAHPIIGSYTSNGVTLTPNGSWYSSSTGVFQSSVFSSSGEVLSGLSNVLLPNTTYTLDLFSVPIFGGTQDVIFDYGTQSGTASNVSGNGLVPFTFTTGNSVTDVLNFNALGGSTSYPSITGFAIVASVPEPSANALIGVGVMVLIAIQRIRRNNSARI